MLVQALDWATKPGDVNVDFDVKILNKYVKSPGGRFYGKVVFHSPLASLISDSPNLKLVDHRLGSCWSSINDYYRVIDVLQRQELSEHAGALFSTIVLSIGGGVKFLNPKCIVVVNRYMAKKKCSSYSYAMSRELSMQAELQKRQRSSCNYLILTNQAKEDT